MKPYLNLQELIFEYQTKVQRLFKDQTWFSLEDEENILKKMGDFYATKKDPFERSCVEGHFTASCLLVNPKTKKMVLTHHKKLKSWLQLGGHCDGAKDLADVALKEAKEESGILKLDFSPQLKANNNSPLAFDFDIHTIPQNKKDPQHLHLDVRFLLETFEEQLEISDESMDLKWFYPVEIKKISQEKSLLRLVQKYLVLESR